MFDDLFEYSKFVYALNNTGMYYDIVLKQCIGLHEPGDEFEFMIVSTATGHLFLDGVMYHIKAILC